MKTHPTGCQCCRSYNNGTLWICGADQEVSNWIPTSKKWPQLKNKVFVPCCNRLELPRNTKAQWYSAYGGYVSGWRFQCAPKRGCNKNPNYRRTAHLREDWYEEID